jgi:hypothetical protein
VKEKRKLPAPIVLAGDKALEQIGRGRAKLSDMSDEQQAAFMHMLGTIVGDSMPGSAVTKSGAAWYTLVVVEPKSDSNAVVQYVNNCPPEHAAKILRSIADSMDAARAKLEGAARPTGRGD